MLQGQDQASSGPSSLSIGAILIDSGRLDPTSAEQVLRLQQQYPDLRFGDAAVQLGLVTEQDIRYALSQQFVYPYLRTTDERVSPEVIAAFNPFAPVVEQLRALRSQLLLRWFDGSPERRMLSIVSPESGDGRSFIAANLAVIFSQLGERTLLLDADMRFPRQHELFRIPNKSGFSAVLSGRVNWQQTVYKVPGLLGLSVIPAGAVPPNPQELLCRPLFGQLIDILGENYDIVIVDTPAAHAVSDANGIAAKTKAAMVIARLHQTAVTDIQQMVEELTQNNVTLVGSLLNKT